MANKDRKLLETLSTADLKRLLAARERIDVLEKERATLARALAKVESELESLVVAATGGPAAGRGRKKATRKKAAKKAVRKKAVKKKVAGKTAVKKKAAQKTVKKKATRRTTRKTTARKTVRKKAAGRVTLEDVVVRILQKSGKPMPYKELFARIVDGKLFRSRSSNFDNVMRRTLSTSSRVKRVARGVYGLA